MITHREIGYIGLSLYYSIFIVTLWRTFIHFIPYHPPLWTARKIFHVLLLVYCVLQGSSFISFCEGYESYTKACYICHLFGIFAEVIALSSINVLWSKVLSSGGKARQYVLPTLVSISIAFLVYICFLVHSMCSSDKSFSDWAKQSNSFRYFLLVESAILTLNGVILVVLGSMMWTKLSHSSYWRSLRRSKRQKIITRLVFTIGICFLSLSTRAILESLIFFHRGDDITNDEWWIFSTWTPNALPAVILLYAMRTPDKPQVIIDSKSARVTFTTDSARMFSYTFSDYSPLGGSSNNPTSPDLFDVSYIIPPVPERSSQERDVLVPLLLGDLSAGAKWGDDTGGPLYSAPRPHNGRDQTDHMNDLLHAAASGPDMYEDGLLVGSSDAESLREEELNDDAPLRTEEI